MPTFTFFDSKCWWYSVSLVSFNITRCFGPARHYGLLLRSDQWASEKCKRVGAARRKVNFEQSSYPYHSPASYQLYPDCADAGSSIDNRRRGDGEPFSTVPSIAAIILTGSAQQQHATCPVQPWSETSVHLWKTTCWSKFHPHSFSTRSRGGKRPPWYSETGNV